MIDNQFFPYYGRGELATNKETKEFEYNSRPKFASPSDPRDVISIWSEESLNSFNQNDLYIGMRVYCIEDKTLRVCVWKPSAGNFTGSDCIWDTVLQESSIGDEWIDVTTYVPAISIDEQIKLKEMTEWEKSISNNVTYWFYYILDTDFSDIDASTYWTAERKRDMMEQMLSGKMLNSEGVAVDGVTGTYNSLQTKKKVILPYNDPSKNFNQMVGANLILLLPSNRSDGRGRAVRVSFYNSSNIEVTLSSKVNRININGYDFDLYIIDNKISLNSDGEVEPKTNPAPGEINNGLQLNFTVES